MLHQEDNFLSPKGIVADKLAEFTSSPHVAFAITEELTEYMKHNDVVIAVINDELCFCRLREE